MSNARKSTTTEELSHAILKLNGRTQVEAFETAKSLSRSVGPAVDRQVIGILRHGRRPFNRAAAAYLLQFVASPRAIAALERTLDSRFESVRVRGEAAEALALNHRKKSHTVLLRNLTDVSKDVRFWCSYSLGQMEELKAIPALEQLAETDRRVVRGFHSVSQEAKDAIRNIRARDMRHRTKDGCAYCRPV